MSRPKCVDRSRVLVRRVPLDVSTGQYCNLICHTHETGESVNGFIRRAIEETIVHDRDTKDKDEVAKAVIPHIVESSELVYGSLIPAIMESGLDIVQIIYCLLGGVELGKTADYRLSNYRDEVRLAYTLTNMWKEKGHGNYTIDDFPEWILNKFDKEALLPIIQRVSRFSENIYDFVKKGENIHFTLTGYAKIITWMEDRLIISKDTAEKWLDEIYSERSIYS